MPAVCAVEKTLPAGFNAATGPPGLLLPTLMKKEDLSLYHKIPPELDECRSSWSVATLNMFVTTENFIYTYIDIYVYIYISQGYAF